MTAAGGQKAPVLQRTAASAAARSAAYALFSELISSPKDDGPPRVLPPSDLDDAMQAIDEALPFPFETGDLAAAAEPLTEEDAAALSTLWEQLFEDDSPAKSGRKTRLTLHEQRIGGLPASSHEEVVRFYEFFGYRLDDENRRFADHLSVLLEFLQLLCYYEARALTEEEDDEVIDSFQVAQLDFLERHPGIWVEKLSEAIDDATENAYLRALFSSLARFLADDLAWQIGTLGEIDED